LKKIFFNENFNISTNNIISVKVAMVTWCRFFTMVIGQGVSFSFQECEVGIGLFEKEKELKIKFFSRISIARI